jgi:hypothetical protein
MRVEMVCSWMHQVSEQDWWGDPWITLAIPILLHGAVEYLNRNFQRGAPVGKEQSD